MDDLNNKPFISVLMTTYNRAKYIEEAIESVIASEYMKWELIILDDCSTDNTKDLVQKYLSDERIKYFKNDKNLGQFANRNKIVQYANGSYLKYVDSDDKIYPNCLTVFVQAATLFPDAGLIGELYFDNYKGELPVCFTPEESMISHYFKGNRILNVGPTSLMYKKDLFVKVSGFRTDIGILADVPLNYEIAMLAPIVGTQKNLIFWRIHNEQVTIGQQDQEKMMIERYRINQLILNHPKQPLNKSVIKKIRRNIKNILARNLIRFSLKLKFHIVKNVIKKSGLKPIDFFYSLRPNFKWNDK